MNDAWKQYSEEDSWSAAFRFAHALRAFVFGVHFEIMERF